MFPVSLSLLPLVVPLLLVVLSSSFSSEAAFAPPPSDFEQPRNTCLFQRAVRLNKVGEEESSPRHREDLRQDKTVLERIEHQMQDLRQSSSLVHQLQALFDQLEQPVHAPATPSVVAPTSLLEVLSLESKNFGRDTNGRSELSKTGEDTTSSDPEGLGEVPKKKKKKRRRVRVRRSDDDDDDDDNNDDNDDNDDDDDDAGDDDDDDDTTARKRWRPVCPSCVALLFPLAPK